MADGTALADATSLLAEVAGKAKRPVEDVRSVLARHGVAYKPAVAVPKRLLVRSVAFAGERMGGTKPGPFSFEWRDLGPGLHGILSQRNFRGKSTLLGVMKWCLTGRREKRVPADMADWFRRVAVGFELDGRSYEVEVADAIAEAGTLWRLEGDRRIAQTSFSSGEGFEAVMSGFFMDQLGLQMMVTHAQRGDKGVDQPHDWVWLFGAMVFDPNPDALFGSYANLGIRMMQMYLGVPWTNAVNDVMAARSRIDVDARQAAAERERSRERRKVRVAELEAEVVELRARLEGLPRAEDQRAALRKANRDYAEAEARSRDAQRAMANASEDGDAADEALAAARRDLHDFREGRVARRVFRSIDPLCCPRCDEVFDERRRRANREERTCVVCNTLERPEGNPTAQEAGLKDAVAAAVATASAQVDRRAGVEARISKARDDMQAAEAKCRRLEAALAAPSAAYPLELQVARAEARLEELAAEDEPDAGPTDDRALLDVAERVTKAARKPLQDELLSEVSAITKDYALRFGVEGLDEVQLSGNAHLRLTKGGSTTHFGDRTDGERTRLKIATTLALITVAERRGLGRHPGLLLVDSPGSNEMVGPDYENLFAGLADVTREMGHLQVFVAAINSDVIWRHVPGGQVRYAEGDEYLW